MKLVKPGYEIRSDLDGVLRQVEAAGRCCYKSEAKIGDDTADPFCRMLISRGHESVIEHASIMVKFVIDRGVSHELVRHRLASFSQESTRYCDYSPDGKAAGLVFVIPPWVNLQPGVYLSSETQVYQFKDEGEITATHTLDEASRGWLRHMWDCEYRYNQLRAQGWKPEQARSVLPNSLKTEIVMTANLREWRRVFHLRTAEAAHPQMREVMVPLCRELAERLPAIFGGILPDLKFTKLPKIKWAIEPGDGTGNSFASYAARNAAGMCGLCDKPYEAGSPVYCCGRLCKFHAGEMTRIVQGMLAQVWEDHDREFIRRANAFSAG